MSVSDMAHAYYDGSNKNMTATDTHKNVVYLIAKKMSQPCSAEEYAIALAKFFVKEYPKVTLQVHCKHIPRNITRVRVRNQVTCIASWHHHGLSLWLATVATCYMYIGLCTSTTFLDCNTLTSLPIRGECECKLLVCRLRSQKSGWSKSRGSEWQ